MRVDAATAPRRGPARPPVRVEERRGQPTAAPEDVESSPTAETVVLPEQDLGQPTRQALAEDDGDGPRPGGGAADGATSRRERPVAELAGDGHTTALDVIALPAELGTELAGLDDQVYQVLARGEPARGGRRRAGAGGRRQLDGGQRPGAAPTARRATGGCGSTRPRPHGGALRARPPVRVEGARPAERGRLPVRPERRGQPHGRPEDVESSPTAETVVLPEQDLGQPTVSLVGHPPAAGGLAAAGPGRGRRGDGPRGAVPRVGPVHQLRGQPGGGAADGGHERRRERPVAELAGDGHTTALDVIALPAELRVVQPRDGGQLGDALEDLAPTVDEVAPTHARVHWPVVALQGTELAGLDDQVEYQVLAREVSPGGRRRAGAGGRRQLDGGQRPGAAPTARRATGGCGSTRPRPHGGALQPGHRYEWKVRARLSGAGYLFGQSDAGSPTAAPEDVESSPTAETVLPEQDLGQPTRQALAEDDAVTGPGCGTTWARCTSCAGSPAAVRLTGPRAPTRAPRGRAGGRRAHDGPGCDCPAGRAERHLQLGGQRVVQPRDGGQLGDALEDLALATVDEVAPRTPGCTGPWWRCTELAGLDDQVEYQVLAREVSLPGGAPRAAPTARRATGGCGSTRPRPHGGALQPGHRYEWKVRARLSGAGYLFGQSDAGSPRPPRRTSSSPTAETVVLPEQDLGQPTVSLVGPHRLRVAWQRQALAEDDAVTGPGCGTTWARCTSCAGSPAARPVAELAGDGHTTALDVIALPAELNGTYSWVDSESYSPETAASWEMPLEDLALATVDEGTELAGLDDQVEYQVLARERPGPPPTARRATGGCGSTRPRPHGGALQPGHRYEWKVRARLSGAGYLFGQSDAGSPTAAPEDVESSPTAETVVLPEQDLGQPTVSLVGPHRLRVAWQRQALAEDDAVTGPGCGTTCGPGAPAARAARRRCG
ncbi:hypothetical protein PAPYR_11118 [Paratrimastix pyriformis]|uniref:Fibronectin type-III domain-containing protein n=1 Tax=Paratrimastix pyriformis TaxID=342808 RepID=A0ABQ8UA88_9EUKA|nr:hypothetical protein PAPYR_11118 [Paratrimastix pyriformis]